jgi:predicted nucleotidyltransferase
MKTTLPKKSEKIKPLIAEFKSALKKIYADNIKQTILFGSYARGTFHAESDIDLLVVLENMENPYTEIDRISDIKFEFMLKYNIIITCLFSNTQKMEQQTEPVYFNIAKEGIII